jgi:hypothetical protein
MKTKLLATATAVLLGLASFSATAAGDDVIGYVPGAEWQIYSWHNWSYEFTDVENNTAVTGSDQSSQKIRNNAANLGFKASIDTGLSTMGQAVKANFQCEQFMQFGGEFGGVGAAWCNRNAKISLSGAFGEIMWGNWLTPYNVVHAGWIDPYWDADFTSHTSLMGTINNFDYTGPGAGPVASAQSAGANGFNKRQDSLVQYISPNLSGLTFRIATTTHDLGDEEVANSTGAVSKLDPRLTEFGAAYTRDLANGDNIWVATSYSKHSEWAALDFACSDSDDTGMRLSGKYTHQWGGGGSTGVATMWEEIEYDWDDCVAGGIAAFVTTGAAGATNLGLEKETWLVSINHQFGNGWAVRGMYLDSDEFECSVVNGCTTETDTDASSLSLGVDFTTSGGTMFSLKYAEVDNEANSRYDTGFWAAGDGTLAAGSDVEVWGVGITQAF